MVFYFSGTGNSLWVAKQLSSVFAEELVSVADELKNESNSFNYSLKADEKVFFVFPVHSWGPAVLIPRFIEKMNLENYTNQAVYVVCTCGDNCGYTDRIMQEALAKKSVRLMHAYSIQMPNNYILMKGFGTDSKDLEKLKLEAASKTIGSIIENIKSGKNNNYYFAGGKAFLKSRVVYPLFNKYVVGKNSFYTTDKCAACGLCVRICSTATISMKEKRPVWQNTCVQCTACIHRCPAGAIEYGKVTQKQGRYHHPVFS